MATVFQEVGYLIRWIGEQNNFGGRVLHMEGPEVRQWKTKEEKVATGKTRNFESMNQIFGQGAERKKDYTVAML